MTFNMNGNNIDTNYRYTLPEPKVQIMGKGNGIETVITNIDQISDKINHPSELLLKYISSISGSSYNKKNNRLAGIFSSDDIKEIILQYIKYVIMCPKCNIPETIPHVKGTKKNISIILCCSACKSDSPVENINKYTDKLISIIITHLKSNPEWKISKGTMVDQTEVVNEHLNTPVIDSQTEIINEEINPFDLI